LQCVGDSGCPGLDLVPWPEVAVRQLRHPHGAALDEAQALAVELAEEEPMFPGADGVRDLIALT